MLLRSLVIPACGQDMPPGASSARMRTTDGATETGAIMRESAVVELTIGTSVVVLCVRAATVKQIRERLQDVGKRIERPIQSR